MRESIKLKVISITKFIFKVLKERHSVKKRERRLYLLQLHHHNIFSSLKNTYNFQEGARKKKNLIFILEMTELLDVNIIKCLDCKDGLLSSSNECLHHFDGLCARRGTPPNHFLALLFLIQSLQVQSNSSINGVFVMRKFVQSIHEQVKEKKERLQFLSISLS